MEEQVIITSEEIALSNANRAMTIRSVRQLPVMRDASNLAFYIAQIESHIPRSLRAHTDQIECLTTRLLELIDLANEDRENRYAICTDAHAVLVALEIKVDILARLGTFNGKDGRQIHTLSKDESKKTKALVKSTKSQLIGWRNSTK